MKTLSVVICASIAFSLSVMAEKTGKEAYAASCVQCHGEDGSGGKESLQGPNLTILKETYVREQFKAILDGKRKGPGTEKMLQVLKESKLSEKEIQAALDYAISMPETKSHHQNIGDAEKGKMKYMICATCHGQKGEGYVNPAIPAPRIGGQADWYVFDMVKSFKAGHRGNDTPGGMQMKAMSMTLVTDDDIKNTAAFVRELSGKK